jgi:hypothetical protein
MIKRMENPLAAVDRYILCTLPFYGQVWLKPKRSSEICFLVKKSKQRCIFGMIEHDPCT